MPTDQVRIRSLYAGLNRTVICFGLSVAAAWLFAIFSYYLSSKAGTDWFARSGSVMSLVGAAVTFRLAHFYQRARTSAQRGLYQPKKPAKSLSGRIARAECLAHVPVEPRATTMSVPRVLVGPI